MNNYADRNNMLLSFKIDFNRIETFVTPVAIIVIAFIVSRIINALLKRYIRRSSQILNVDPTNYSFLQSAVSMMVFLVAVFFVVWNIPQLHDLGRTLFAGAGILAAIIGFASQEAFSNIITGAFIVIYKPYRVGDNIKLLSSNQSGVVEDITLRHTIIKGNENRRIIIPNSVISREQILNSSIKDERIQLFYEVRITYDSDHNKAMDILREEAVRSPYFLDARSAVQKMESAEPVPVKIVALEEKGVLVRASVWSKNDGEAGKMKQELNKVIKEKFASEKIKLARNKDFD